MPGRRWPPMSAIDTERCDALAVARACVARRVRAFEARGAAIGIELPCGPLPWLWLDEGRLHRMLDGALASLAKGVGHGDARVALWLTSSLGQGRLHVELYTDEPGAGLSFDIALDRMPAALQAAEATDGRALVVGDHAARCRIVGAQLTSLGLHSDACATGDAALATFARTPYALVWLDEVHDLDRATLARSLRGLARKHDEEETCLVSTRGSEDGALPDHGIDALLDWPVPLEAWRALCAGEPWPEPDREAVASRLFFEESRRDMMAMQAALALADWATLARHAHRVKGGTVVLGEDGICAQAERIEEAARSRLPDAGEVAGLLATLENALRER